jgi:DNA-binding winged helix-turn-helix (wHTH) protein
MDGAESTDAATVVFRFGDFTFHQKSHLLLRNGERQHLSPKAWQLLDLLLTAWPSARSRREIYDVLWPSTFVCETNMAGVVSELRRILGDDARTAEYIRTVHGYGYVFCGNVMVGEPGKLCSRAALLCEGQSHPLFEGVNTVGRSPHCRIILTHHAISRHHAVIVVEGDTIRVEDLGSKNGTYVDGRKVESARLTTGSRLKFGVVEGSILRRRPSSTAALHLSGSEWKRLRAKETANP